MNDLKELNLELMSDEQPKESFIITANRNKRFDGCYCLNVQNLSDEKRTVRLLDQIHPLTQHGIVIEPAYSGVEYLFILKEISINPFKCGGIRLIKLDGDFDIKTADNGSKHIGGGLTVCYQDGKGRSSSIPVTFQRMLKQEQESNSVLDWEILKENEEQGRGADKCYEVNLNFSLQFELQPQEKIQVMFFPLKK